jgi:hypothetical protein
MRGDSELVFFARTSMNPDSCNVYACPLQPRVQGLQRQYSQISNFQPAMLLSGHGLATTSGSKQYEMAFVTKSLDCG